MVGVPQPAPTFDNRCKESIKTGEGTSCGLLRVMLARFDFYMQLVKLTTTSRSSLIVNPNPIQ